MPALDTEVLFALNPRDRKHEAAMEVLKELRGRGERILVPDTAILEFQAVLRGIGRGPPIIRAAILALRRAIEVNGGREVGAIDSELIARQCEIEEAYGLSYFDSLIAASALRLDGGLVSDDRAFDRVPGIRRIPLSSP
ncbi:MAG: PIN domain-containing protein [Candidatus Bathyarchaeia archaeon]